MAMFVQMSIRRKSLEAAQVHNKALVKLRMHELHISIQLIQSIRTYTLL